MITKASLEQSFQKYQEKVDLQMREVFSEYSSTEPMRKICSYAFFNGGRRIRPILVFLMAEALNLKWKVDYAALAVELFHTASLIADDLPCMDDSDFRRNQVATHKKYGQAPALLGTFSLIAKAYQCIQRAGEELMKADTLRDAASTKEMMTRLCLALENSCQTSGIEGIQTGQYFDLYPQEKTRAFYDFIIQKKTAALFENAFVLGWLFGGGKIELLAQVKKAALHFGTAFQIADDLQDIEQDRQNGAMNLALLTSQNEAVAALDEAKNAFIEQISQLSLRNSLLEDAINAVANQVK